jgi:hypothetical protein
MRWPSRTETIGTNQVARFTGFHNSSEGKGNDKLAPKDLN